MIDIALLNDLRTCESPETLLAAILRHDGERRLPVDVELLARKVGVVAFRDLADEDAKGGPAAGLETDGGVILTAPGLSPLRRRFAIAHELGHFLLRTHTGDRRCTTRDLAENRRDTAHRKEEMQANRFAAGLLMPKPWFADQSAALGKPSVAHVPALAATFGVTLEAAAARYADLTQAMCAFVFAKDGVLRYARPARSFPALSIAPGAAVPPAVLSARPDDRIAWVPADPRDWIALPRDARPPKLTMQILSKSNGFQLVMLFINAAAEQRADEEAEKAATESPKFGRRPSR